MLCLMFECSPRGVLITGSSPWSRDDVAAAVGGNGDVARVCIDELVAKGVCKVRENDGALYSKRLVADETAREMARKRVRLHREKQRCNGAVTPTFEDEDEAEDHRSSKVRDRSPAEDVYELYPKKVGRVAALKAIARILAASEPEMQARLLERTAAYAAAVAKWPPDERQFIPHPATWFNRGSFDDDPSTWVRETIKSNHANNRTGNSRSFSAAGSYAGITDKG
jgi:hypothetical protein